ncbi:MAG: gluconate 2-dehydrogenase subunit 3 family protein [Gammaproteobacteria bacterium]
MATRREVLQGLIISLGGASALSACGGVANVLATRPGMPTRFYTTAELGLVSRISDLIIPRTETPGALDVNVPGYLDGLMSDWANDETRQEHRQALDTIDDELALLARGDFRTVADAAAESALIRLDGDAFNGNGELAGYRRLKGYITNAYFATEEGAIEELKWVAVPGRWDPAVDISRG